MFMRRQKIQITIYIGHMNYPFMFSVESRTHLIQPREKVEQLLQSLILNLLRHSIFQVHYKHLISIIIQDGG
jgi:hypothetical protein